MVTGRSGTNGFIQMGAVLPKNRFINLLLKSITFFLAKLQELKGFF